VIKEARPGHRRRFSAEEKRKMLDEAATAGESVSSVARRYGIAPSVMIEFVEAIEMLAGSVTAKEEALRQEAAWSCPCQTGQS
jgi:transposase-like protein